MTDSIKNELRERAKSTKKYFKGSKKEFDFVQITALSNECKRQF